MNLETLSLIVARGAQLLAQTAPEAPPEPPDFRPHVWLAYGLVLGFLGLFTLVVLLKLSRSEKRLEHLVERFEKVHPDESEARG